jgi:hypothetical protein
VEPSRYLELSFRDKRFRGDAIEDSGNDLVHYRFIASSVLGGSKLTISGDLPPPGFVGQELLAYFGAFIRITPKHCFNIFRVKPQMFGSTLCAKQTAELWDFE